MKFIPGNTYMTRSICDHECIFTVVVTKRTEKSVWFTQPNTPSRGTKVARIRVWSGVETFQPFGQYSMAPTMSADKLA